MAHFTSEGFHHSTMVTNNAGQNLRFYRDLLGLHLVKQTVNFDDPSAYHLYYSTESQGTPGTLLTFFEWPKAAKGRWGIGGIHHIALGVADEEAQLKWKRRLIDHNVPVSGPFNRGYFKSIYFSDPDGQILEIATAGPGFAIDEPADALGQKLMMPKAEQLRGQRDEEAIRNKIYPEPVETITPDMQFQGIHHLSGITDDLQRADDFLHNALGLRLVKQSVNQDDPNTLHYFWANYDGQTVKPHSDLTLFGWPGSRRRYQDGAGQTQHIAFRAQDESELEAWREHLLQQGIDVTPVKDRTYFKSIYFDAPDGMMIEIATDGPGFAVDEAPEELGQSLQLPPWLEDRREQIKASLAPLP